MKKLMTILIVIFIVTGLLASITGNHLSQGKQEEKETNSTQEDSTLRIVAHYSKGDTCDYGIYESNYKITGKDTTYTYECNTDIRIVVNESSSKGYKMSYTIKDVYHDTTGIAFAGQLIYRVENKMEKFIVGLTMEFETDKEGKFIQFTNLPQVKKLAKKKWDDTIMEVASMREYAAMFHSGMDYLGMIRHQNVDKIVDTYAKMLGLVFMYHGMEMKRGKYYLHTDATDKDFTKDYYYTLKENQDSYYFNLLDTTHYEPSDAFPNAAEVVNNVTYTYNHKGWLLNGLTFKTQKVNGYVIDEIIIIKQDHFSERRQ